MSLFKKKNTKVRPPTISDQTMVQSKVQGNGLKSPQDSVQRPQLVFQCQQAQGSPVGLISGFSNVKELYQKIAECYDFSPDDVSMK